MHNDTRSKQWIYVVRGLKKPFLGKPAIEAFKLLKIVQPVNQEPITTDFQDLFEGLGKLQDNYHIKLKPNHSVCRERHIFLSVDQSLAQISGAKVFSKLDANSGFWQIELSKESALLTTFITPFGRFCFNRLPFGITSAPEHFQKRMSEILTNLDGVVCQMDDILVFGKSYHEHDQRLRAALKRIRNAGLTLNKEKCQFSQTEVKFLGHNYCKW